MTEAESRTRGGRPRSDASRPSRSRLVALRVGDLRALAASLGIGNTATMRKGTLVDAIDEQYDTDSTTTGTAEALQPDEPGSSDRQQSEAQAAGDDAGAGEAEQPPEDRPADEPVQEPSGFVQVEPVEPQTAPDETGPEQPGPEQPTSEQVASEQTAVEQTAAEQPISEQPAAGDDAAQQAEQPRAAGDSAAESPVAEAPSAETVETSSSAQVDEAIGGAEAADSVAESVGSNAPKSAAGHVNAGLTGIAEDLQALQRAEAAALQGDETPGDDAQGEEQQGDGERQGNRRGRGRGRGRSGRGEQGQNGQQTAGQNQQAEAPEAAVEAQQPRQDAQPKQDGQQARQDGQQTKADQAADRQQAGQQQAGQQQDGEGRRGRYRDRKRRGTGGEWDEPEIRDDDVLIPIAGILDVLDNYAFVRTSGYLAGTNDVYVSLGQVKKYHLRRGDAVVGSIRQIPEGEQPARQKYNALVKVDSINGLPVADAETRVEFDQLTPLYPQERLRLETEPQKLTARVVDLVAPIGKGQRGLVVAPPRSGTTLLLQGVANAITTNNPEAHLMVVLVDERPEEVTEMQRTVKGEVVSATFDRAAEDQTTIADLAIERAKRLVELGYDVVVLLDSITRLTRAYAQTVPVTGRQIAEGIDAAALQPAKRFFAAARNVENGGSLTVLATALVETGSPADDAILAEFTGTANMELVLSSALAEKRIFPAIDITHSGTRREEMLMGTDEVKVVWQLRRAIAGHSPQEALDVVTGKLRETSTNVEFLVQMQKSLPSGK